MNLMVLTGLVFLMAQETAALAKNIPDPTLPPLGLSAPEELDLIRTRAGGPRIYVNATLPNGKEALFMIDTGADISVLSQETAQSLRMPIQEGWGRVEGLSGNASANLSTLETLRLGNHIVKDIDVLVGVPGMPTRAGALPLAGLLGNNVWSQFGLEIDYPADLLVLHDPNHFEIPKKHAPLFFDGGHIYTTLALNTPKDPTKPKVALVEVDTGSSEITLCATNGLPFDQEFTEGLEWMFGLGAPETVPPYEFLKMTRRIPLTSMHFGGHRQRVRGTIRWVNFEEKESMTCPAGMPGIIGHEYMKDRRVLLDYTNGKIAVTKSHRPQRQINGHERALSQQLSQDGSDPNNVFYSAQLLVALDRINDAILLLEDYLREFGDPSKMSSDFLTEATISLGRAYRLDGRGEIAFSLLRSLPVESLLTHNELIATVNGLLLTNENANALALAEEAVQRFPDAGNAWVALSDAQLANKQFGAARQALMNAVEKEDYRDAHLLRRSRLSLASGDRYGAIAHMRRLLELYPFAGQVVWFYSQIVEEEDLATFLSDVDTAMARLHPHEQPLDFLVAAGRVTGAEAITRKRFNKGLNRDCAPLSTRATQDNCYAWYNALAGRALHSSLKRIDRALQETGARSEFLDTKAVLHLSLEQYELAHRAAVHAAQLAPEDIYMLWQVDFTKGLLDANHH